MPKAAIKRTFPNLRHSVRHLGNCLFEVSSASHRGEHYNVELRPSSTGGPRCPCKGYEIRKWCTHIDDAIIYAVREGYRELSPIKAA